MITISTPDAPEAIGPYSQAVWAGDMLILSGQIGLDPATGQMVEGGVGPETERICANISAVLKAGGLDLGAVVETTIFLADIADFTVVNGIYGKYFAHKPARSTVAVSALPRSARVEIRAVAWVGE